MRERIESFCDETMTCVAAVAGTSARDRGATTTRLLPRLVARPQAPLHGAQREVGVKRAWCCDIRAAALTFFAVHPIQTR